MKTIEFEIVNWKREGLREHVGGAHGAAQQRARLLHSAAVADDAVPTRVDQLAVRRAEMFAEIRRLVPRQQRNPPRHSR